MTFFTVKEWIKYFHLKTDEHSLHSPFFYDFYTSLIREPTIPVSNQNIEQLRGAFLKEDKKIEIQDLGAGSQQSIGNIRKISTIAKHSLSSKKFSIFLYRLIEKYQFKHILELGTSIGINTAYLAQTSAEEITSFEGDPNLFKIAQNHLIPNKKLSLRLGNIDNLLPEYVLNSKQPLDLVYVDANHTYEATLNYFHQLLPLHHESSIFIFDDIHWSKGMNRAWEEIKATPSVKASIDLFDAGLIFFNPTLNHQHLNLHF